MGKNIVALFIEKMLEQEQIKYFDNNKRRKTAEEVTIPLMPIGNFLLSTFGGKLLSDIYVRYDAK